MSQKIILVVYLLNLTKTHQTFRYINSNIVMYIFFKQTRSTIIGTPADSYVQKVTEMYSS